MNDQRLDILLTRDGDLHIDEWGDIKLTDSVRQAVRIRLQWFFNEWRFAPEYGVPYFEDVFIKNPDLLRIRRIVRDEAMSVEGVLEARDCRLSSNLAKTKPWTRRDSALHPSTSPASKPHNNAIRTVRLRKPPPPFHILVSWQKSCAKSKNAQSGTSSRPDFFERITCI